jgi:hypothetical protein
MFNQTSVDFSDITYEYPPAEVYDWKMNEIIVEWCGQSACVNLTIQRWDLSHADNAKYIINPDQYQIVFFIGGICSLFIGLSIFYIEYKRSHSE